MTYQLYLNGKLYGAGGLQYIQELIADMLHCEMYGQVHTVFEIVKVV